MHRMPPYQDLVAPGQKFVNSDAVADAGISLPSAVTMAEDDVERVCRVFTSVLAECRMPELLLN
jgi:dTDP-4-amino-4,6-dideoxygalactose transaminase